MPLPKRTPRPDNFIHPVSWHPDVGPALLPLEMLADRMSERAATGKETRLSDFDNLGRSISEALRRERRRRRQETSSHSYELIAQELGFAGGENLI